jgi:hypothetical protein
MGGVHHQHARLAAHRRQLVDPGHHRGAVGRRDRKPLDEHVLQVDVDERQLARINREVHHDGSCCW